MPDDRFIHRALGHSEKVNLLTDLEFRCWHQYLLSADDFGVMRFSAVTLQSDNDALHAKPTRTIQRCLERVVDVALVVDFEHQNRRFVCQLDWQYWQRIKNPRKPINPCPPASVFNRCDEGTRALFVDHHPMMMRANGASPLGDDAASDAHLLTANGLRLTAVSGSRERFAEFWRAYPRKVGKEPAWQAWQRAQPDEVQLGVMLAALTWQVGQESWLKEEGKFIPHPATWLRNKRWQDEAPRTNVRAVWTCPHEPNCAKSLWECKRDWDLAQAKKARTA